MMKVIVFDFDDTLKKTERIKKYWLAHIFSDINGGVEVAQKFIHNNHGKNRYETIHGIVQELKKVKYITISDIEEYTNRYIHEFSRRVESDIIAAEEICGARDTLEFFHKKYQLYLNSATPQNALERIISNIEWNHFFKGLYGSPPGTKIEHLGEILTLENVSPNEVVVIGDGDSDQKAAETYKCRFIGVRGEFSRFSENAAFPIVNDLKNIQEVIQVL